jgi:hypothetical protein
MKTRIGPESSLQLPVDQFGDRIKVEIWKAKALGNKRCGPAGVSEPIVEHQCPRCLRSRMLPGPLTMRRRVFPKADQDLDDESEITS